MRKIVIIFLFVMLALAGDPKKGVGCDGACNAITLDKLQAKWYYTWGAQPKFSSSVPFVPMCWAADRISQLTYSNHLLGFNEPDHVGQADISPRNARVVWDQVSAKTYNLGSPAMASNIVAPNSWMEQFFKTSDPRPRVDFIAVHHYGANSSRLAEYLNQINTHPLFKGIPIWLTQFAPQTNADSTTKPLPQSEVDKFMAEALPMLRDTPFVHRYAWHSASSGTSALYDANGQLTTTGLKYSAF